MTVVKDRVTLICTGHLVLLVLLSGQHYVSTDVCPKSLTYDLHRHHRPMDLVGFTLVLGHSTRPDSSIRLVASLATRRILASNSDGI